MTAHPRRLGRESRTTWVVVVCFASASGCYAPQPRVVPWGAPGPVVAADPISSPEFLSSSAGTVIVAAPRSQDAQTIVEAASGVETWIVHTRTCEQKLGSDPWSSITIGRLDDLTGPIRGGDPDALLARMTGRPSVFFIHGNGYTYGDAVDEAVKIRTVLEANGGFPAETLFIIFDWPSERERDDLIVDLNEQARRCAWRPTILPDSFKRHLRAHGSLYSDRATAPGLF